jgi:hypothetical protein
MVDNTMKHGPADRARINIDEGFDVRFWCRELGIAPQELRYVVALVGPMVDDVKEALAHIGAAPQRSAPGRAGR